MPFKLRTRILLSPARCYLVTPEGSACPIKLSSTQRDEIADNWHKIQDLHQVGFIRGTLYSRPTA